MIYGQLTSILLNINLEDWPYNRHDKAEITCQSFLGFCCWVKCNK